MKTRVGQTDIEITQGDITDMETEAIVNAANERLQLGAGVAGAIRNKGGPSIQEECDWIGHCPAGDAVVTRGGNLKARFVIHAVGPRMGEGDEDRKLTSATLASLHRADEQGLKSVALPAISTGIYGFPLPRAAQLMLAAAEDFLKKPSSLTRVAFCLYGSDAYDIFAQEFRRRFGG